jgi:prepilin-type N-terminal cleavage/methylation domain-containing protein
VSAENDVAERVASEPLRHLIRMKMKMERRGFTLVELVIVLAVIAAAAGLVVPLINLDSNDGSGEGTLEQTAKVSLQRLRETIIGSTDQAGYYADLRRLPQTIADLFVAPVYLPAAEQKFNPATRLGWRGPYVQNQSGTYGVDASRGFLADYSAKTYDAANIDAAVLDPWGNPIVIQAPTTGSAAERLKNTRVVSAGANKIIETNPALLSPAPSTRGDDVVVFLLREEVAE